MMSKDAKKNYVEQMKKNFTSNESVMIAQYQGLNVNELDSLRKELREKGILFKITKNRITKIAIKETSKKDLEKNPNLKGKDHEEMKRALKHYNTYPVTVFSFAEGTRLTKVKHSLQLSPYINLLKPKEGGLATAISLVPKIDSFINFTIIYKSNKRGYTIKGDVDFNGVSEKAKFLTPVPGGVGPMTIACILANTLTACCRTN